MELKPGYKQTEVGVIPEEWEVKKLSEISPKQSVGLVINPSTYFDPKGSIPMLVGSNVRENRIDAEVANRISVASNIKLAASRLSQGDLVTVRVGDPGVTAVVPPDLDQCNCASMMIVRQDRSFNSLWLCSAMNSRPGRQQVENVQYGTAQKQFNIKDAVNFIYAVPPLEEQNQIATVLRELELLLLNLEQLIAKKRDIKQAAMQELLTGKRRLPGFVGEWEVKSLGSEISDLEAGVSVVSLQGKDQASTGRFVLKTSAVTSGQLIASESKEIAPADLARAKTPIRKGDVIISRMNTPALVGECGYSESDYPNLYLPDRLWRVAYQNPAAVSSRWLAYSLSFDHNRTRIKELATGTSGSMKNISKHALLSLRIKWPTSAEQQAVANYISLMDEEVKALSTKLVKTRALKKAMMQELLTGRIRLV